VNDLSARDFPRKKCLLNVLLRTLHSSSILENQRTAALAGETCQNLLLPQEQPFIVLVDPFDLVSQQKSSYVFFFSLLRSASQLHSPRFMLWRSLTDFFGAPARFGSISPRGGRAVGPHSQTIYMLRLYSISQFV